MYPVAMAARVIMPFDLRPLPRTLVVAALPGNSNYLDSLNNQSLLWTGVCCLRASLGRSADLHLKRSLGCYAASEAWGQDQRLGIFDNGEPVKEWEEKYIQVLDKEVRKGRSTTHQMVHEVKRMLASIEDGEISASPYDTAWVALVRDLDGTDNPQFPSSLQWIIDHQLPDGSWGEESIFLAHDRMLNTLACVVALKSWNVSPEQCEKGLIFLRGNMWRLAEEDEAHMTIGFEVAFPSLMEMGRDLDLDIPHDDPIMQNIYAKRELKLKRIPIEVMHKVPTSLLYSLEGMPDLDWETLLDLQCANGSFLFSASSTAYAVINTGDRKCLDYLNKIVQRFNGGVPNVYPVDLFERLWAVDRLERLGISRHFQGEIKDLMDYAWRYWSDDGICWARNTTVHDGDVSAMGFRLLRLHGYDASADVFENFEEDGEFFCFVGQSSQPVTAMYNLNRASQVMFEGEKIMERAKRFSYGFLREKQAANRLVDKWIISKDLAGEVEYALDFPWYASLPRVETRLYLDQYGGKGDVWIGKTLYRMGYVNNELYLELAKSDFNLCQKIHQLEWNDLKKWYEENGLDKHGVARESVLKAYFLATSCIFEPERSAERLGWAKTAVLADAVSTYYHRGFCTNGMRMQFIGNFNDSTHVRLGQSPTGKGPIEPLLNLIDNLVVTSSATADDCQHQLHIGRHLRQAWKEWLVRSEGETGLLLVRTTEVCGGRSGLGKPKMYNHLSRLVSSICHRLSLQDKQTSPLEVNEESRKITSDDKINSEMQELVQCVLQSSDGLSNETKQTFLHVAKSYYYAAHCPPPTLQRHISKVLFEPVV